MFSLHDFTKVKVLDVQLLSQKNRPAGANPGVRLSLQADLPNYVLAAFDGSLRTALFTKSAASEPTNDKDRRQTLPGVEPVSDLPNLTSIGRHVKKISWSDKLTGYTITIDHGTGGKSNLVLTDASLERFRFQAKEGGTVAAWWSVEIIDVAKPMLGELGMLKSREAPMTFREPQVQQQDIDDAEPQKATGQPGAGAAGAAGTRDGKADDSGWPFPGSGPADESGKAASASAPAAAKSSRRGKMPEQAFAETADK